jgi:hypothetical protein
MSIDASITLNTVDLTGEDFIAIIESLINYGWSLDDFGKISYMKEEFDWYYADLGKEKEIYDLMRTIIEKKGNTAITLTWENTKIGGSLIYYDSSAISLSLIVNPLRIKGLNTIDFSWYLERLKPLLNFHKGFIIECNQAL